MSIQERILRYQALQHQGVELGFLDYGDVWSDASSPDPLLRATALKCLGLFLSNTSYLEKISDDMVSTILRNLVDLATQSSDKLQLKLSMWCISVQQFKPCLIEHHIETLIKAIVCAIDSPLRSLSVIFEALQALRAIVSIAPAKARLYTQIWTPPLYRRLLSIDKAERGMVSKALDDLIDVIRPCSPELVQICANDIQTALLETMRKMVVSGGQGVAVALSAWKTLVELLEDHLMNNSSLVNEIVKIPASTFARSDIQTRLQSYDAWESLIESLISTEDPQAKHIKLLLMPVLSTIRTENAFSVKTRCCETWIYLLRKLGKRLEHRQIFKNSVLAVIQAVATLDPIDDPWTWRSYIALVERYASASLLTTPDFARLTFISLDLQTEFSSSPLEEIGSFELERSTLIKSVEALEDVIGLLRDCGMNNDGAKRNWSLAAAARLWYIIVKTAAEDQHSPDQQEAIQRLVKYSANFCNSGNCSEIWTWNFIEVLINELGTMVLASPFYKVSWSTSSSATQQITLEVRPIVYLLAAWFDALLRDQIDVIDEAVLEHTETLLSASRTTFDVVGNVQEQVSCLTLLDSAAGVKNSKMNSVVVLRWWNSVAEQLRDYIEDANDIGDEGCVCGILLFPLRRVLRIRGTDLSSAKALWMQLYDSIWRVSSLKNSNSRFLREFYRQLVQIIDEHTASGLISTEFLELAAFGVGHELRQADFVKNASKNTGKRRNFNVANGEMRDVLSVANRVLMMAQTNCSSSTNRIITGMLEALAFYSKRTSSQHEALRLLHVVDKPLRFLLLDKTFPTSLLEKLHQLWDGLLSCLQKCHPEMVFDSDLLQLQSSCLAPALEHRFDPIPNRTLAFWESTYAKNPTLVYPRILLPVLAKLKSQVAVTLPGISSSDLDPYTAAFDTAPDSFDVQAEERFTASLKRVFSSPIPIETVSQKKSRLGSGGKTEIGDSFVIIPSQPQKQRPLTDHQKEVRKFQREQGAGVKTYTSMDFSQAELGFEDSIDAELFLAGKEQVDGFVDEAMELAGGFSGPNSIEIDEQEVAAPKNLKARRVFSSNFI